MSIALPLALLAQTAVLPQPVQMASMEIIVTGARHRQPIRSATKTDTPLQDVPQAVSIIDQAQIEERGLVSMTDVLRTVAGASVASGEGHRDQIILRGQNTTADFFVDGIRDDVQYYRGLYNLDRVEVLKGPNAMIFGRGGGGGIVNRVTKKAVGQSIADVAVSLDTQGSWGGAVDLAAPLSQSLSGRVNAAYDRFDSFRDHVGGRRVAINPTLGLVLDDRTRIDLSYEFNHDRRTTDRGIPSLNGRPYNGPRAQYFGDPDVNRLAFDAHVGDLAIEHRFSDSLRWTAKARVGRYRKFYSNALAATPVFANGTVGMEAYQQRTNRDSEYVQNDVVADVTTGPLRHTLLAGIDYSHQDTFADRQQGYFDGTAGTTIGGTRLAVPLALSDNLPTIVFRTGTARAATAADSKARSVGVYVQDQVKIGDHVELIGGVRRDWFTLDYADRLSALRLSRKDAVWSPRLGLVVKPMAALSLYASWSKSFLPQSGDQFSSLTPSTALLAPEKFLNREIGAKWAVTSGLDVTLAGYVLERTNTRFTNSTGQTLLSGAERSKGIEASIDGRLGQRLTITGSAAVQRAKITSATASAVAGKAVASVPHFTTSLWGRYNVSKRIGFGLGLYHQSDSFASTGNAVVVPAFTRVDAAAFLGLTRQVALQLNVENLFDKNYIGLANGDNNLTPGNPRTLRATLRFRY